MSLFVFDTDTVARQLLPPLLRGPRMIAWMKVILSPVQWVIEKFLLDYSTRKDYPDWESARLYHVGNIITWQTKENFMCVTQHTSGTLSWPSGQKDSNLYWLKIQDNFIGVDERVTYNAQIIKLEQELNRWFRITTGARAYIHTIAPNNEFLIGNDMGDYVVNNIDFISAYMCNDYNLIIYDFIVYVPYNSFPSLMTNLADQEKAVRQFVDQYKVPGTNYKVMVYTPPPPPPSSA